MESFKVSGPGGVASVDGLQVGPLGVPIYNVVAGTVTVDIASISAGAVVETSVTITGVAVGDFVLITGPDAGLNASLVVGVAYVSAANTVKLRVFNSTGGALDPASASFRYLWIDCGE